MTTSFTNAAIFKMALWGVILIYVAVRFWYKGGIADMCMVVSVFALLYLLQYKKMRKRIELTQTELSVKYPFFPFRTFWHSYREYDGVIVVDISDRMLRYGRISLLGGCGRHLYIVKDHRLKIDIFVEDHKNAAELERFFEKHLPFLAHVKSYGYIFNPGRLEY